jgi:hypothetical protein
MRRTDPLPGAHERAINEDARCVTGMNLLRQAYLQIVPDLEPFFVIGHPVSWLR